MNSNYLVLSFIAFLIIPFLYEGSFAQETLSPRQQWKQFADPDLLTCKEGHILLQKNNGYPVCVTPSTYLKLIDRDYAELDFSLISNRQSMMDTLMQNMVSNQNLMSHWHEMMLKNPNIVNKTMNDWILQMKENPELLTNMLGPMTSDPELRQKMISEMKKHPIMEDSLKQNPRWMVSIHQSDMNNHVDQRMHSNCKWCPEFEHAHSHEHSTEFSHSDKMMDLMHHIWINDQMRKNMHEFMLENPTHLANMSNQMMSEILVPMMDDSKLRENMTELMLEHQEFMNSIRHEN